MAKDFRLESPASYNVKRLVKASATVLEAWDMVALDTWLAIKAVAASTAIAFCMAPAADWETEVVVCADPNAIFVWTADANFAVTDRWLEVDLVWTTTQLIDLWESTTDVFKVLPTEDAWTAWATTEVKVKINKFLF